jgi:hypothetical protein
MSVFETGLSTGERSLSRRAVPLPKSGRPRHGRARPVAGAVLNTRRLAGTETTQLALFDALVDDAGLFPPEELSMAAALSRHRADVAGGERVLSQRFVCPSSRLGELSDGLEANDHLLLSLIVTPFEDAAIAEAVAEVGRDERLELAGLEGPLPSGAPAPLEALPDGVAAFAEIPVTGAWGDALEALRSTRGRVGAKIRCGGVRVEMFPTAEQLGALVQACLQSDVPFKATAGLHRALRYRDETTGFEHHGYLNLLVAASRAASGSPVTEVIAGLDEADAAALVAEASEVRADAALTSVTRRLFVSYGSCSTREPVDDLRDLGLLD